MTFSLIWLHFVKSEPVQKTKGVSFKDFQKRHNILLHTKWCVVIGKISNHGFAQEEEDIVDENVE